MLAASVKMASAKDKAFLNNFGHVPILPANNAIRLKIRIKSLVISTIILLGGTVFSCEAQNSSNQTSNIEELPDSVLAAQCIMVAAGPLGLPDSEVLDLIKSGKIGGVLFLKEDRESVRNRIQLFQKANEGTGYPPLIFASDAEPGLYGAKIKGGVKTPWAAKLESVDSVSKAAMQISQDLSDLGIHMNFAPVCDLNSNTSVIGIRSFGSDPLDVSEKVTAFITESERYNIATAGKHFPGHGLALGDTHKQLVFIDGDLKELEAFKDAISAGCPMIMVGHIEVRNSIYQTNSLPASCSDAINKNLIRDSLKFDGVIVTDALNMGALNDIEAPGFSALKSGADLALMPRNAMILNTSLRSEMAISSDFRSQIRRSGKRILAIKERYKPKEP